MRSADIADLVGQLTVSYDRETRKLGLYLFESLEIAAFPQSAFADNENLAPRLLFYEAQRTMLGAKAIARILVAVTPFAATSTDGFHDEVFDELKLQSHNFAGSCRAELDVLAKDTPMVEKALKEVAEYFVDLKRAHEAGIGAMEVAGHRRAIVQHRRRFSREVSRNAAAYSPLFGMMKRGAIALWTNDKSVFRWPVDVAYSTHA